MGVLLPLMSRTERPSIPQSLKAPGAQLFGQGLCGHGRARGPVMKLAQIAQDGALQPAGAVMAAVGMEVGSEVGADRQLELTRSMQGRPAQRAFCGDVHHVGSLYRPLAHQHLFGRQPHAQARVAGDGHAGGQQLIRIGRALLIKDGLRRSDQLQPMPPGAQALDHPRQGEGDAIDLGRVGLGDHGDAHGRGPVVEGFDVQGHFGGWAGIVHDPIVSVEYIDCVTSGMRTTLSHQIHAKARRCPFRLLSTRAQLKEMP